MDKAKWILNFVLSISLISFLAVGCEGDMSLSGLSYEKENSVTENNIQNLSYKKKWPRTAFSLEVVDQAVYPQSASITLSYNKKEKRYSGGMMIMINGSSFTVTISQ